MYFCMLYDAAGPNECGRVRCCSRAVSERFRTHELGNCAQPPSHEASPARYKAETFRQLQLYGFTVKNRRLA